MSKFYLQRLRFVLIYCAKGDKMNTLETYTHALIERIESGELSLAQVSDYLGPILRYGQDIDATNFTDCESTLHASAQRKQLRRWLDQRGGAVI
jgi:hypothetical protein